MSFLDSVLKAFVGDKSKKDVKRNTTHSKQNKGAGV